MHDVSTSLRVPAALNPTAPATILVGVIILLVVGRACRDPPPARPFVAPATIRWPRPSHVLAAVRGPRSRRGSAGIRRLPRPPGAPGSAADLALFLDRPRSANLVIAMGWRRSDIDLILAPSQKQFGVGLDPVLASARSNQMEARMHTRPTAESRSNARRATSAIQSETSNPREPNSSILDRPPIGSDGSCFQEKARDDRPRARSRADVWRTPFAWITEPPPTKGARRSDEGRMPPPKKSCAPGSTHGTVCQMQKMASTCEPSPQGCASSTSSSSIWHALQPRIETGIKREQRSSAFRYGRCAFTNPSESTNARGRLGTRSRRTDLPSRIREERARDSSTDRDRGHRARSRALGSSGSKTTPRHEPRFSYSVRPHITLSRGRALHSHPRHLCRRRHTRPGPRPDL